MTRISFCILLWPFLLASTAFSDGWRDCYPKLEATAEITTITDPLLIGDDFVHGVGGYVVKITNPTKAEFFIPNTENEPVNCRVANMRTDYCSKVASDEKTTCLERLARKCMDGKATCKDLGRIDWNGNLLAHPLHSGQTWFVRYPYQLMFSASFFYVGNFDQSIGDFDVPMYPYVMPCTNIVGPLIINGHVLSNRTATDHHRTLFDVFGITKDNQIVIESNSEYALHENDFHYAFGGILLFKDGATYTGRNENVPYNRMAIATDDQGNLFLAAIWGKTKSAGLTSPEFVEFLKKEFNVTTILQTDQGGSSYFRFESIKGLKESPPLDNRSYRMKYRPIPNFLGVRRLKEMDRKENLHDASPSE